MADIGDAWGVVEAEPEVAEWLMTLSDRAFGQAYFAIELLQSRGSTLGEPYTRQLIGKLRELRFYVDGRPVRVTYYVAAGRRIVLLTVFAESRAHERVEIARAEWAMRRCIVDGHATEED